MGQGQKATFFLKDTLPFHWLTGMFYRTQFFMSCAPFAMAETFSHILTHAGTAGDTIHSSCHRKVIVPPCVGMACCASDCIHTLKGQLTPIYHCLLQGRILYRCCWISKGDTRLPCGLTGSAYSFATSSHHLPRQVKMMELYFSYFHQHKALKPSKFPPGQTCCCPGFCTPNLQSQQLMMKRNKYWPRE